MVKKDIIIMCLLHILSQNDLYGYEIIRQIYESFPDTQESTIYAILRQICKDGYTEQYSGLTSGGPTRKYYRITQSGKEQLQELLIKWHSLRDSLTGLGL